MYPIPNKNEVEALYEYGYSIKDISVLLGTGSYQIKKILKGQLRPSGFQIGHKVNNGKKYSEERIDKIRQAQKGIKRKPLSKEHREKISKANIGKVWNDGAKLKVSGCNSHLWKGGLTKINILERCRRKYHNWRKDVFQRDNYICQITGKKGGKLEVHHILNFATHEELRYNKENGVTMEQEMHNLFHNIYGKKGNNLEQLNEFKLNYGGECNGTF